jgi:hypothetical protein
MAVRIVGFSIPGPTEVIDTVQALAEWAANAAGVAAALPTRVDTLVSEVEHLLRTLTSAAEHTEVLLARTDAVVAGAERNVADVRVATAAASRIITSVEEVTAGAAAVVSDAAATAHGADQLLSTYQSMTEKVTPLARRFIDELSEEEAFAAIRLVHQLPALLEYIEREIFPVLITLDRVGPDINELLQVTKEVQHAITGIPGFARLRRRGAERDEEDPERSGSPGQSPQRAH